MRKWKIQINSKMEYRRDIYASAAFALFDSFMEYGPPQWIWGYRHGVDGSTLIAFGGDDGWIPDERGLSRKERLRQIGVLDLRFDDWIQIDQSRWHDPEYLELLAVECWERIVLLPPTEDY